MLGYLDSTLPSRVLNRVLRPMGLRVFESIICLYTQVLILSRCKGISIMTRLAHLCFRHRKIVALTWVIALIFMTLASRGIGSAYSSNFTLPNTESKIAMDLITKNLPSDKGATIQVVFASKDGNLITASEIAPVVAKMKTFAHVVKVDSPFDAGSHSLSADGKIAFANIHLDDFGQKITIPQVKAIVNGAQSYSSSKLEVELLGEVISKATQPKPGSSEMIALLAAAIVLFVTFGSLVSMLVPIGVAVVALGISSSLGGLMSHAVTTAEFAPILSALVGLGVGLDYALFIVTRYRQSLHAGESVEESVVTAIRTSGKAVLFAGVIVCIALLGLFTVGVSFLYGVALAASVSVLITMTASLTLLPAILGMVGNRIDKFSMPGRKKNSHEIDSGRWASWAASIQRRPILWTLVSASMILILCIPVFSIRIGSSDAGNDPKTSTTRLAYDLLAKGFGPGYAGPLTLVATIPEGSGVEVLDSLTYLESQIDKDPDVATVLPAFPSPNGKIAIITVFTKGAPQDASTTKLIHRLRDKVIPSSMNKGGDVHIYVGGVVAIFDDFGAVLTSKLPVFIGSVVLLSFLLLMILFRSVLIPLKAALMNIVSISAAFGVVVAGFQWGWLDPVLGGHGGPIESFLPIILFAILFGLSMDYEVFLVSRIQEEWLLTKDNSLAVRRGLSSSGSVITSAALIMMAVFLSFAFGGARIIQLFGIGLFTAILIDATIIRSALVPALMQWWGPANWWLPKWLDKLLPKVSIEGSDVKAIHEEK